MPDARHAVALLVALAGCDRSYPEMPRLIELSVRAAEANMELIRLSTLARKAKAAADDLPNIRARIEASRVAIAHSGGGTIEAAAAADEYNRAYADRESAALARQEVVTKMGCTTCATDGLCDPQYKAGKLTGCAATSDDLCEFSRGCIESDRCKARNGRCAK